MANFEPVRGESAQFDSAAAIDGQMYLFTDEGNGKLVFIYAKGEEKKEIVFNADIIDGGELPDPQPNSEA